MNSTFNTKSVIGNWQSAITLLIVALATSLTQPLHARPAEWVIRDGKFYLDGERVFLKIAKPLRNFADEAQVDQLIADLEILRQKNYNAIEINCYWHHFDQTGDGSIDVAIEPLRRLVDAIHERGMFPCLSVETYGVGGGQLPKGFFEKYPDAIAINSQGRQVSDDEYGFGSIVPSIFSPDYLRASRAFIRNITQSIDHAKILWFETTVEPQYMGLHNLDYTVHARRAYEKWREESGINGPRWPDEFPVPEAFLTDPIWNRFRAEALADWVNRDAAVFREVAGEDAYVAVDYLETCGPEMRNRNGDSLIFLRHLTCADIIQVNWHWHVRNRTSNQCAYDNVWRVKRETRRDWAITEHMTINGSDYRVEDMPDLLRNTIRQGTQFGWEFVNVAASDDPFSVYNPDWSPKPTMRTVDEHWEQWMREVRAAADGEAHDGSVDTSRD